jgi:hypothetical protein
MSPTKSVALLRSLDALIAKHAPNDPDLLKDLLVFRDELHTLAKQPNFRGFSDGLRLATLIKFIHDIWPD